MPLSENEQRLLEQMERALYDEDPKFATTLRGSDLRAHYRKRLALAAAGFGLGVVALLAGAVTPIVPLGVVGFLVMLGSAWYAMTAWRRIPGPGELVASPVSPSTGGKPRRTKASGSLVERAEERWRRRRDEMGR
jgi:hypothetical protein